MPAPIYNDKVRSRRKKFAPKTRTGCVNCKARYVCLNPKKYAGNTSHEFDADSRYFHASPIPAFTLNAARKDHPATGLPKTWLFDPKANPSQDNGRRSSMSSTTSTTDSEDISHGESCSPQSQVSTPSNNVHTNHSLSGPGPFRTQQEHDAFSAWVTFLVRHCEPKFRFPDKISLEQEIWGVVIPQIAFHSVALREVLIACGTLVLSVEREFSQAEYDRDMTLVLSHATKAIQELATHHRPLIEVVLTAYTLWTLDTMSCRHESAIVHARSALKIARQCHEILPGDALASTLVQHMVFNLQGPDMVPSPDLLRDPPGIRRMEAVAKLENEYARVTACAQRVVMSDVLDKNDILATLEESRQELQWILSRYNTMELYVKWVLNQQEQTGSPLPDFLPLASQPGLFQPLVEKIDEYISTADEAGALIPAPVDVWRKVSAQETLMFMVMVAGTDLSLRHITLDFMEVSRQIRWPASCPT
ncbi:hypothetical protein H2200_002064 [Cladophialophora chaetospira]|uniref:Uncharacterized protein n=1 Tax=Cladophialophora chaetospira TaxID=386627 RepID=A0AA39CN50_9EURO|nr:hypothetical protein H2200_002064 [Cladophialophora chaetospira]